MRIAIVCLLLGVAAGWLLRGAIDAPPARSPRANRVAEAGPPESPPTKPRPPEPEPAPTKRVDGDDEREPAPEPASTPEAKPDPEQEKAARLFRGMLPLIKMQAAREAKEEAAVLRELLGLTEDQQKRLAEVLHKSRVQTLEEGVLPLMEGKEPDGAMLALLQEEDGVSPALAEQLGTVLSAHQIERYKEHNRERAAKERANAVEEELERLSIPDLDDEQARQVRAILDAELQEGSTSSGVSGDSFTLRMKKDEQKGRSAAERLRARRDRLARVLTPAQLEHVERQHAQRLAEIEEGNKLVGKIVGGLAGEERSK